MADDFSALDAAFATDRQAEADGVWAEYSPDVKVRVRRSTNPLFKLALRKAFKRFRHMGSGMLPEQEDIVKDEAVASALIVDWSIKGVDSPYTPEAGLALFKRLPDFRRWCEDQGDDIDNFKNDANADGEKSSGSSNGSGNGDDPKL